MSKVAASPVVFGLNTRLVVVAPVIVVEGAAVAE